MAHTVFITCLYVLGTVIILSLAIVIALLVTYTAMTAIQAIKAQKGR